MTPRDTDAPAPPETPAPASAGTRSHRRRWIVAAAAATVVILVGAGAGYAVSTESNRPDSLYAITVMLDPDVTAGQKAAVLEELKDWNPTIGPTFRGSDDIASMAAEVYQNDPETLERAADMPLPAMIVMTVESPTFDCEPVPALRELPGVQSIMIDGAAKTGGRHGRIECP
jgi:cell division protein FtsX